MRDARNPLDTPVATQSSHASLTSYAGSSSTDSLDHDVSLLVDMKRVALFTNAIQGLAQMPGIHLICSALPN